MKVVKSLKLSNSFCMTLPLSKSFSNWFSNLVTELEVKKERDMWCPQLLLFTLSIVAYARTYLRNEFCLYVGNCLRILNGVARNELKTTRFLVACTRSTFDDSAAWMIKLMISLVMLMISTVTLLYFDELRL